MFKINVEQFAILADAPSESFNIKSSMKLDFSLENRNIRISMNFEFTDNDALMMLLKMNCEFNVHEQDWNSFKNGDKIVIPKQLLDYFISQTVGTARGILYCKTESTPFSHIVLPPLDVSKMVASDIEIPLKG